MKRTLPTNEAARSSHPVNFSNDQLQWEVWEVRITENPVKGSLVIRDTDEGAGKLASLVRYVGNNPASLTSLSFYDFDMSAYEAKCICGALKKTPTLQNSVFK